MTDELVNTFFEKEDKKMITYDKLWILLKEKGLNKTYLRNNGFYADNITWLVKNKDVRMSTINKLCNLLECTPNDILTYTPDAKKGENNNE